MKFSAYSNMPCKQQWPPRQHDCLCTKLVEYPSTCSSCKTRKHACCTAMHSVKGGIFQGQLQVALQRPSEFGAFAGAAPMPTAVDTLSQPGCADWEGKGGRVRPARRRGWKADVERATRGGGRRAFLLRSTNLPPTPKSPCFPNAMDRVPTHCNRQAHLWRATS